MELDWQNQRITRKHGKRLLFYVALNVDSNLPHSQEISVQTKTVTSFVTASSAGVPAPEIAQATTTATTTATTPAVPTVTLVLGTIANNPGADNHLIIAEPIPGVTCTSDNLQNVTFSGYKINGAYLQYLITCGTNWGETYNGDYVHDLQVIANVTSFSNCLNECSLYSVRLPDSQSANSPSGYANFCSGALWRDDNACYLKGNITKGATGFPDSSIQGAAVLVPPSDGSWGVSGYYCGTQYGSGYSCT